MGAAPFANVASGKTAQEAFSALVAAARAENGCGGYSGTVAEKREFVMIDVPAGITQRQHVRQLMDADDSRITDARGPAGCVQLSEGKWAFFGWAPW